MTLTEKQFSRLMETAKSKGLTKYKSLVAKDFQKMIRAEAAAKENGYEIAVVVGELREVFRVVGQLVCVTCGKCGPYKDGSLQGAFAAAHYISRRHSATLLDPRNIAVCCLGCNNFLDGNLAKYRLWMDDQRPGVVAELERLKNTVKKYELNELVHLGIDYRARTRAAEEAMGL